MNDGKVKENSENNSHIPNIHSSSIIPFSMSGDLYQESVSKCPIISNICSVITTVSINLRYSFLYHQSLMNLCCLVSGTLNSG